MLDCASGLRKCDGQTLFHRGVESTVITRIFKLLQLFKRIVNTALVFLQGCFYLGLVWCKILSFLLGFRRENPGPLLSKIFIVEVTELSHLKLVRSLKSLQKWLILGKLVVVVIEEKLGVSFDEGVLRLDEVELGQELLLYFHQRLSISKDIAVGIVKLLHFHVLPVEVVDEIVDFGEL